MSDKTLEELLKEIEPNFNSHIEKGTIEMSIEYYNLLEERMIRLLNENKKLEQDLYIALNKIDKAIDWCDEIIRTFCEDDKQVLVAYEIKEILGDKENE